MFGPNAVVNYLKNKEQHRAIVAVESPEYQRVYAYLIELESKGKTRNLDEYKFKKIESNFENGILLFS